VRWRRSRTSLVIALLPLIAFVHEADTSTAQGEAIFARAVQAAEHEAYANDATYAVTVRFANGARHVTDTWNTTEDIAHGTVIADAFSQEERRRPTVDTNPNVTVGISLQSSGGSNPADIQVASLNPQHTGDPVGPVAFAVDQNFGLTPPRSYQVTHDVSSFLAAGSGLVLIGHTATELERYRVTLLDADATSDHLALTPLRDPYHNRLRELWVDPTTAGVREAIVQGVGDRAPLDRVRWDVTFVQTGGATYVAEERALEPLDYGRGGQLRDARVTFDHLTLMPSSPFRTTFGVSTPVKTLHDP
jgi:hypothetical protein